MNMKKIVVVAVMAACAYAHAAYEITGTDSLAVGNMAGKDGIANRTVVIGTGAGAYMQGGDSNLFVGAAAGLRAVNVKSSVGMGHYAFRGTTNMNGCVGIGDLAFAGQSGSTGATWINGQFFAEGGMFWIKPNRDMPDDQSPIYYNAGNLYLNAGKIISKDGTTIGSGGSADGGGYDYYVSDAIGDDFNDGLTVGTAFKTLDRAYEVATNHQVVGVLAGRYAYPTNYYRYVSSSDMGARKPVKMIALSGPDKTFITTEKPSGNPGSIMGCFSQTWTYFEGFTFKGCVPKTTQSRDAFVATYFNDCVFTDMMITNGNHCGTFEICVMEKCKIQNLKVTGSRGYGFKDNQNLNPHIFGDCYLMDCVVDFANIAPGSNIGLSVGSRFENVFMTGDWIQGVDYWPHRSENLGVYSGFENCTVSIATNTHPSGVYYMNNVPHMFKDCLVGIDGCTEAEQNSIVTNYTTMVEAIDPSTLRPVDEYFDWYFYGYGSRLERLTKNAIVKEVLKAIEGGSATPLMAQSGARNALLKMVAVPPQQEQAVDFRLDGLTLVPPQHADDEDDQ